MKCKEIAFTVLPVRDVRRAREFYTEKLGLKETAHWQDKGDEVDIGPGTLAITDGFEQLVPGAKGAMVALELEDFTDTVKELEAKGMKLAMATFDTPVCVGATILDPDGNEVMLHQRKPAH